MIFKQFVSASINVHSSRMLKLFFFCLEYKVNVSVKLIFKTNFTDLRTQFLTSIVFCDRRLFSFKKEFHWHPLSLGFFVQMRITKLEKKKIFFYKPREHNIWLSLQLIYLVLKCNLDTILMQLVEFVTCLSLNH